jgi:methanogenic corrinoid protein MtbC1
MYPLILPTQYRYKIVQNATSLITMSTIQKESLESNEQVENLNERELYFAFVIGVGGGGGYSASTWYL